MWDPEAVYHSNTESRSVRSFMDRNKIDSSDSEKNWDSKMYLNPEENTNNLPESS